jgi:hypothetical protein
MDVSLKIQACKFTRYKDDYYVNCPFHSDEWPACRADSMIRQCPVVCEDIDHLWWDRSLECPLRKGPVLVEWPEK